MQKIDVLSIKPFEICSIKPPTENYSLTFRLTRNCYWNKCSFCPVYKLGAKFSRRSIEDIIEDIKSAKLIDDYMYEQGIGTIVYSDYDYQRALELAEQVKFKQWEAGFLTDENNDDTHIPENLDPRMSWFLSWFKDKPTLTDSMNQIITWRIGGAKTCFLGDADSLILRPDFLNTIINEIKINFPTIQRFTIYGRTGSAAKLRSLSELKVFKKAGIDRVHFGIESGNDMVLKLMNKGVTQAEHIEGCLKIKDAGISCSVYIMPGLGGMKLSEDHAFDTAHVISKITPDFVRLRSLEIFPHTSLDESFQKGDFVEATEEQMIKEIKILIENINTNTHIMSDSASNLLNINGTLPDNKDDMLHTINEYLTLSEREKLIFSLNARIQSFVGQYGMLTHDIYQEIAPYIKNKTIDTTNISNQDLFKIITLIRSKLMP